MTVGHITPNQMFDCFEAQVNGTEYETGIADAVAGFGKLVSGEWTPEFLSDVQDEVFRDGGMDYGKGYTVTWKKLYDVMYGHR